MIKFKNVKALFGLVISILIIIPPIFASQKEVQLLGVEIPGSLRLTTKEMLQLNGYAALSSSGRKIFVAALYTNKIEKKSEMMIVNDNPMAMVYYVIQDDISPEELKAIFTESILINNGGWENMRFDKERMAQLQKQLEIYLNAGDKIAFEYSPSGGLSMLVNDAKVQSWDYGKSFFNMILRTWIGPFPPSREFKKGILSS